MKAAIRTLLAGLAFWLFGAAAAQAQTPAVAPDPALRVLVMLQLPPAHFRGNGDYGGSYGDAIGHSARRRVAARIAREEGLTLADDWPMPMLGVDCFVMELPPGQEPQAVAERISRRKSVAWAEPMNLYHTQGGGVSHADPLFQAQPAARLWRLNALHEIATGRNVRVEFGRAKTDGKPMMMARVEEGHFENGQWVFDRLWNGDQTDYGLNFTGGVQILRVKLAVY